MSTDAEEEELQPDTLLAVLEALYDAHRDAARLSYNSACTVYDPRAAMELIDGVARLHLWLGRAKETP